MVYAVYVQNASGIRIFASRDFPYIAAHLSAFTRQILNERKTRERRIVAGEELLRRIARAVFLNFAR